MYFMVIWLYWVGVGLGRQVWLMAKIDIALEWWLIVINIGIVGRANIPLSSDADVI
jgi:hypothetical protein